MRRLLRALRRRRRGARDEPPVPDDELPLRDVVDDPAWFRMGVGSYGRPRVWAFRGDVGGVTVGSYTSIGPDVTFLVGGNHRIDWVTTWPVRELCGLPGAYEDGNPWSRGPITVGSDVWIGMGATVLSGVTIGDGAVVAAAAVVTRDVRPFAVVAGNPAVETHRRFDDATVDRLLAVRWWDWPLARVRAEADLLCQPDVGRFLDAVEGGADPG